MSNKKWIFGIVLGLFTTPILATPVVFFDFDGDGLQDTNSTIVLGDTLTASLYVSNVDNSGGGLLSWGTEINFTNSLLSASSYSISTTWPLSGANNNINNSVGSVELLATSFSAQAGTVKLADISFDTLDIGMASLTLDEIFPYISTFSGFVAANGYDYDSEIDFSSASATINITAVPVPGALFLFLSGFIALVRFKKK